ncbi:MAG: Cys-tRNA(Pro) deacylase [Clostridia bacterium]|jgi:Cys-tRNA(Pro)/Cys-tRNA(Cys) deacylase|nr:Cys-tRNA(Pro) deacylase [Clostridia bacterium]
MKNKTNAMRLLESAQIEYRALEYEVDENDLSGMHIAHQLSMDPDMMFKTIVARGEKQGILVFCIPVSCEIDLKKAAQAAGDKRVELLPVKELLGITGYIRGGCSPVGMKKKFPTFIDETCLIFDQITVSAGVRGCQLLLDPEKLVAFLDAKPCDLTA